MQATYETTAQIAAKIRIALKCFRGVKFSVVKKRRSIRITWTDGPPVAEVEKITNYFEGASFNPMEDLKTYRPYAGNNNLYSGADYVFCDRSLSAESESLIAARARELFNLQPGEEPYADQMVIAEQSLLNT